MADYVDKGAQTSIAGLTKHPSREPSILFDSTTPPLEDTPAPVSTLHIPQKHHQDHLQDDKHLSTQNTPTITMTMMHMDRPTLDTSPSLLLRRKNRPNMQTRISMPTALVGEIPRSPPPTDAVMSPLPLANRLHAGHTPIIPRSMSPLERDDSGPITPDLDEPLSGPLQLPAQPGDGGEELIELKVLDKELEKIARAQGSYHDGANEQLPSQSAEFGGQLSRTGSAGSHRSSHSEPEVVDGVILKKPRMNMGAPLGQA